MHMEPETPGMAQDRTSPDPAGRAPQPTERSSAHPAQCARLPWKAEGWEGLIVNNTSGDTMVLAPGGRDSSLEDRKELAQFIVRAVNAHDALVEALRDAEFLLRQLSINWKEAGSMRDSCARSAEQARAALRAGEGA